MIISDGYGLYFDKPRNQIIIGLPQTALTQTNTLDPVVDRKVDVSETDLAVLLILVKRIFQVSEEK